MDSSAACSIAIDPAARPRSRAARRLQVRVVLLALDLSALAFAVCVAAYIRLGFEAGVGRLLILLLTLSPLFAITALYNRAYAHDVLERWPTGARRAVVALAFATLMLLGLGFALKVSAYFSRLLLFYAFVIAAVIIMAVRSCSRFAVRALLPDGSMDVLVLHDDHGFPVQQPARLVNAQALGLRPSLNDPQMLDLIGTIFGRCDRVVLSCRPEARLAWVAALKGLGVEVQVLMPELDALGVLGVSRLATTATAVVARGPLRTSDMVVKRAFDLLFAAFCLPVLLFVTGVVALLIKLDDGGPVFFRQQRVGLGNRPFAILKFRTMRTAQADATGTLSARRDDDRVTRVGHWLRRTSIDELPQLYNVLAGEMSIVGPRPHALGSTAGDRLFWDVDHRYWWRHSVKPGLTGLAQVRGFRGATAQATDLINRVQADLDYLVGWTLWRDLRIVARTARVLFHENAF